MSSRRQAFAERPLPLEGMAGAWKMAGALVDQRRCQEAQQRSGHSWDLPFSDDLRALSRVDSSTSDEPNTNSIDRTWEESTRSRKRSWCGWVPCPRLGVGMFVGIG